MGKKTVPVEIVLGYAMKKKHSYGGGKVLYHCASRDLNHRCKASIAYDGKDYRIKKGHSHELDEDVESVIYARWVLHELAISRKNDAPKVLIYEVRSMLSQRGNGIIGSNESLRRLIHNARPKISVDFAAADADNVVIQGHLTATRDGNRFLLHDSVSNRGKRLLMFASELQLQTLKSSKHLVVDGTFCCTPKPFTQTFTLLAEVPGTCGIYRPVVHVLMESRDIQEYLRLYRELLSSPILQGWKPQKVTQDFEGASKAALLVLFPATPVHYCYFHLIQSWRRKLEEFGLDKEALPGKRLHSFWLQLRALPFVEETDVVFAYREIAVSVQTVISAELDNFLQYIETYYVFGINGRPPRYAIASWCCFDAVLRGTPRTSNALETYHKILKEVVFFNNGRAKVKMSALISKLQVEEERTAIDVSALQLNPLLKVQRTRKLKDLEKDSRLLAILRAQYNGQNPAIPLIDYLNAISNILLHY